MPLLGSYRYIEAGGRAATLSLSCGSSNQRRCRQHDGDDDIEKDAAPSFHRNPPEKKLLVGDKTPSDPANHQYVCIIARDFTSPGLRRSTESALPR